MSFSTNMVNVATKLITKYGSNVTLREFSGAMVFDPTTGETTQSSTDYDIMAAVENYTLEELKSEYVNTNDLKLTVVMDKIITKDWRVIYLGNDYNIVSVGRENAQNLDIVYYLQLRL